MAPAARQAILAALVATDKPSKCVLAQAGRRQGKGTTGSLGSSWGRNPQQLTQAALGKVKA